MTPNDTQKDSSEPTVEIPVDVARTALLELDIAIRRTGGEDTNHPSTPLALTQCRIEQHSGINELSTAIVLDILGAVAEQRGVEVEDTDPLTSDTFRARNVLKNALAEQTSPEEIVKQEVQSNSSKRRHELGSQSESPSESPVIQRLEYAPHRVAYELIDGTLETTGHTELLDMPWVETDKWICPVTNQRLSSKRAVRAHLSSGNDNGE